VEEAGTLGRTLRWPRGCGIRASAHFLLLSARCLLLTGHSSLFTVLIGHCSQAQTHREQTHWAARFPSEPPNNPPICPLGCSFIVASRALASHKPVSSSRTERASKQVAHSCTQFQADARSCETPHCFGPATPTRFSGGVATGRALCVRRTSGWPARARPRPPGPELLAGPMMNSND